MSKIGIFHLFYFLNRRKETVITYHNIIPDELFDDSVHLGVSHRRSIFENHIQLIQKRSQKKKNRFLITFDDGYNNQYTIASKMLEKYKLHGVFFISFKPIIDGLPLVIDIIMQWVSYVPDGNYQIFNSQFSITSKNRQKIVMLLYEKLLKNYQLWNTIEKELNIAYPFEMLIINSTLQELRFKPMKQENLLSLIEAGHIVASHSWDHRPLASLPIEAQEKDFALCKTYARKYCNSDSYSYPYGGVCEVSPKTAALCKKYGFSSGYMNSIFSPNWQHIDSHYQLPRLSLPNDSNIFFIDAKLSGFEFFIKNLLGYFHAKKI